MAEGEMDPRQQRALKLAKSKRDSSMQSIFSLKTLVDQASTDKSVFPVVKAMYCDLAQMYSQFRADSEAICKLFINNDCTIDQDDLDNQTKVRDAYYHIIGAVTQLIPPDPPSQQQNIPTTSPHQNIHLPKINLPKFDGNPVNFKAFYDSFLALIHDDASIPNIQKFIYLRGCVTGSAASAINVLPLNETNYDIAWQTLKSKYEDKQTVAFQYLNTLFDFTPLQHDNYRGLEHFHQVFSEYSAAFQQMCIPDKTGFLLYYLASRVIDSKTRKQFLLENTSNFPVLKDLLDFVKRYQRAVQYSDKPSKIGTATQGSFNMPPQFPSNKVKSALVVTKQKVYCDCCQGQQHSLFRCDKFLSLSVDERQKIVKALKVCFNCLSKGHMVKDCQSKGVCRSCSRQHNSLLCFKPVKNKADPSNQEKSNATSTVSCSVSLPDKTAGSIYAFLGTALVDVFSSNGDRVKVRAMIDCASQSSFLTTSCMQRLGLLQINSCEVPCVGLGSTPVASTSGAVNITIQCPSSKIIHVQTILIPKIVDAQPSIEIPNYLSQYFTHLNLADPNFTKSTEVDLLLGLDVFSKVFLGKRKTVHAKLPDAWKTIFGWVIMGPWCTAAPVHHKSSAVTTLLTNVELDSSLQAFWKLEEVPSVKVESPDDLIVEEMYKTRHYREENGRYVVPILTKPGIECLGRSREIATSRLRSLQMRLNRDSILHKEYVSFINEYHMLGHMSKTEQPGTFFIPHHPVVRNDTRGMKLRVVFNGSSHTTTGQSLNDFLYAGPKLQKDIVDVLTGFRFHKIGIVSDIRHMYRMINIIPSDRHFQHILWASKPEDQINEYELNTITYGLGSSPYLALRTIQQLVQDEGSQFQTAAKVLTTQLYVDDILTGANSDEEANILIAELNSMFEKGKFSLHKWVSNCSDIFPDSSASKVSFDDKESSSVKVLGVHWCILTDSFSYHVKGISSNAYTKRSVLSEIARLFDPLGWIAPVTLWAKQLMQRLWKLKIGWDDCLPEKEMTLWKCFVEDLPSLSAFSIPRFVLKGQSLECRLVGFCDASSTAYGAVVFLRTGLQGAKGDCNLLMAKTKVAPVKPITIPRLELMGAVLLTHLITHAHKVFIERDIHIESVEAFTDSTVVLSWIATPVHLLTTFVCHRVAKIINCDLQMKWSHVSTNENPADIASKGAMPSQLLAHDLWTKGPAWLAGPLSLWPSRQFKIVPPTELPDIKKNLTAVLVSTTLPDLSFIERFSCLAKLQRTAAYIMRWRMASQSRIHGVISPRELHRVLLKLVQLTQSYHFSQDIASLQKGACKGQLLPLSPFVDKAGCLRVGGRLKNSSLAYHEKHPLILPKSSHLTQLLIDHYHKAHLHVGANTLHYILRARFWIIAAKVAIRSRLHKCLVCRKLRANPSVPIMGDLPSPRVNYSRPFLHCGIDFGGPFFLKDSKRRNAPVKKAYLALFVCLAVKAIHLEVVSDLTTEAFLAALDRFTARRGLCTDIYTDGGRTFVGADRCLKEVSALLSKDATLTEFSKRSIQWHFNPPFSPNFGGLWEAGIKSAKSHLKRVIGCQHLTFEELTTVFARVEAVLNSRPLVGVPTTPSDSLVLSPSHFLIGSSLCVPPEQNLLDTQNNYLTRWQLVKKKCVKTFQNGGCVSI